MKLGFVVVVVVVVVVEGFLEALGLEGLKLDAMLEANAVAVAAGLQKAAANILEASAEKPAVCEAPV